VQPRLQHSLDLTASFGVFEAGLNATIRDDEQRRHRLDAEPLCKVGPLVDVHLAEDEGAVVSSALQDLGDQGLDPAAAAGHLRVEEDKPRAHLNTVLAGADCRRRGCPATQYPARFSRGANLSAGGVGVCVGHCHTPTSAWPPDRSTGISDSVRETLSGPSAVAESAQQQHDEHDDQDEQPERHVPPFANDRSEAHPSRDPLVPMIRVLLRTQFNGQGPYADTRAERGTRRGCRFEP
jgi:hypothetical protein